MVILDHNIANMRGRAVYCNSRCNVVQIIEQENMEELYISKQIPLSHFMGIH